MSDYLYYLISQLFERSKKYKKNVFSLLKKNGIV